MSGFSVEVEEVTSAGAYARLAVDSLEVVFSVEAVIM